MAAWSVYDPCCLGIGSILSVPIAESQCPCMFGCGERLLHGVHNLNEVKLKSFQISEQCFFPTLLCQQDLLPVRNLKTQIG